MNALTAPLLVRRVALSAILLLLPACGKKETVQADPPKQAAPAPVAPAANAAPAAMPITEPAIAQPATPAVPISSPTPAPPPAAKKAAPVKPAAPAVYVRAGPLVKAQRLAEYLGTLRPGDLELKLSLAQAGDAWTIRQPVGGINLPDLPPLTRTAWLHLQTTTGGVLVPFAAMKSMTLAPISQEKDKVRARLTLPDGTELAGVVQGRLGGVSEYGLLEVPWRALKEVEVFRPGETAAAVPLPLAGKGVASLADGTHLDFTAWAPVVGDVVSDVLLAEAGTGPEIVSLASVSAMEFVGSDNKAFFYQHAVALTTTGQAEPARRNVALTSVLLQQANGCILCLAPGTLRGLTLAPR